MWVLLWFWVSVYAGGLFRCGQAGHGQLGRRFEFLLLSVAEISAPENLRVINDFGSQNKLFLPVPRFFSFAPPHPPFILITRGPHPGFERLWYDSKRDYVKIF